MMKSIRLLALRNTGRLPCSLRGYPTVRSSTSDGRPVRFSFSRSSQSDFGVALPVRTVTLGVGSTARVEIGVGYLNCAEPHVPGRVIVTLPGDPAPLVDPDFYPGVALCPGETVWVTPVFDAAIDPYQQPN